MIAGTALALAFAIGGAAKGATPGDGVPSAASCAPLGIAYREAAVPGFNGVGGGPPGGLPNFAPPPSPTPRQAAPNAAAPPSPPDPARTLQLAPTGQPGLTSRAFDQPPIRRTSPGAAVVAPPRDTERYPGATANPVKRVGEAPVSTFSIDVDTAAYANVRRFLNEGQLPPKDAVRVEELINYFDYGYARPTGLDRPFQPTVTVVPSPWAPGKEFVHVGLQGYDVPRQNTPPLNLVFLVDVSGSMFPADRLPLAKKALNVLVDQLRDQDRVAMVVYAGAAGAVLAPTGGAEKLKIRCAIAMLEAGGSTAGGQGLALAYQLAQQNFVKSSVNRVVLMTDGDFNVGISDPARLKDFVAAKRATGVYLSVYGFGRGNYNDTMMQTLSQSGNGTAAYVDTLQEARKLFRDEFNAAMVPIADDVKIEVEFNPARIAEYRLIGYETRLLNREDFNNDKVDAGEIGAGASVTALYEVTPVGGPLATDPLRYQTEATPAAARSEELAYLRIRYKAPGEATSKLIERAISPADRIDRAERAPEATRFALAVAAYGQWLRGDPYLAAGFDWKSILNLADGARGADPYGTRAEFVQLVRAAASAKHVNE